MDGVVVTADAMHAQTTWRPIEGTITTTETSTPTTSSASPPTSPTTPKKPKATNPHPQRTRSEGRPPARSASAVSLWATFRSTPGR